MRALTYHEANDVRVDNVPDPIMGQTHVQKYLTELLEHIEAGRLQPELIVTHRLASKRQPWATRCSIRSRTTAARSSSCQALHGGLWALTTCRGDKSHE